MRVTIELDDDEARALLKARGNVNDLTTVGAYGAVQIGAFLETCRLVEQRIPLPPENVARWIDASVRAMAVRVEQVQNAPPRPRLVLEGSVMTLHLLA